MVSRLELIRQIEEEIRPSASSLLTRLPIVPVKTEIIGSGHKNYYYDNGTILRKLKLCKCRRGTKSKKARDLMIEYLKGVA